MEELEKAVNDAISSVLKERNIPSAVIQAKITVDGGSEWMTIAGMISGTEHHVGGSGGKPD
ncbi:TPA: hypothetical protein I3317_001029 [Enterobacter cloacae subsp. cloacae]|nr:hypothetical protein [Enterobacter cloacae subsp. cloacae]